MSASAKLFNSGHALGPLNPASKLDSDQHGAIVDDNPSPATLGAGTVQTSRRDPLEGSGGQLGQNHERQESSEYPPHPYPSFHLSEKPLGIAGQPQSGSSSSTTQVHRRHDTTSTAGKSKTGRGGSASGVQIFGTPQNGIIGQHKPRDIVRLDRDYSEGETCQFWSGYPFELEGRINATQHMSAMNQLNAILASAFDPYKSIFDNVLAVLSLYISTLLLSSHYDREIKRFEQTLDKLNDEVYNPAGLNLLNPRKQAYLFLELEYY